MKSSAREATLVENKRGFDQGSVCILSIVIPWAAAPSVARRSLAKGTPAILLSQRLAATTLLLTARFGPGALMLRCHEGLSSLRVTLETDGLVMRFQSSGPLATKARLQHQLMTKLDRGN